MVCFLDFYAAAKNRATSLYLISTSFSTSISLYLHLHLPPLQVPNMIPGSRIRVMKPPVNREDLRSAEGRVVSLIPSASQPLRYKIKLATGMFEMPSTSLHLIDYHDDHDGNNAHNGDMLKVNGLCYCKDHRLEICGTCGYSFRCQNLSNELSEEIEFYDAVEIGVDLDAELRSIGASGRRAPAKEGSEYPFDMYTPIVNDAIVNIVLTLRFC